MAYRNIEPLSKQFTIIVGLTVVGIMAFTLALSTYKSVLFDRLLENMKAGNVKLEDSIEEGYQNLEYYQSAQYRDKFAKEHLGKVQPGEKVLIITEEEQTITGDTTLDYSSLNERQEAAYLELLRQMPIIEHWQIFLFAPEKVEELKKAL